MAIKAWFSWGLEMIENGLSVFAPDNTLKQPTEWTPESTNKVDQTVTIGPEESYTVWAYSDVVEGFSLLLLQPSGELYVSLKSDAPTSASNPAAAGTAVTRQKFAIGAHLPTVLSLSRGISNPSAANHAGSDFADSGQVAANIYHVTVYNPSEEDDVALRFILMPQEAS
jgi:hypothetical protein